MWQRCRAFWPESCSSSLELLFVDSPAAGTWLPLLVMELPVPATSPSSAFRTLERCTPLAEANGLAKVPRQHEDGEPCSAIRCNCMVDRLRKSRIPVDPSELQGLRPAPPDGAAPGVLQASVAVTRENRPGDRCGAEDAKPRLLIDGPSLGKELISDKNIRRSSTPSVEPLLLNKGPLEPIGSETSLGWPLLAESKSASPLLLFNMASAARAASLTPRWISCAIRGSTSVVAFAIMASFRRLMSAAPPGPASLLR
mmetsp:Transcript_113258/g.225556  ORF Transcript_113258/g.225556 Transcript_113258/m.225556 type:complete len:255 (+) Transcript_113258:1253-2017(+)